MTTRLVHLVIDSGDPARLAMFWADALGWEATIEGPEEASAAPAGFAYPGTSALPIVFIAVPDPKTAKNRIHLDLASTSLADQQAQVERLIAAGATHVDIGQGDVPWVVLADPEGNELCVLEPRPVYSDTGPVAAVVVDSIDRETMAGFWTAAADWPIVDSNDYLIQLRSPQGEGPFLEFLVSDEPKRVKNRVHLDVAPYTGDDAPAEITRLLEAGAKPADVGQGSQSWTVLADPEGQEFCVLSPR